MGKTIDLSSPCGYEKTVMTDNELLTIIENYVCNLFPDELTGVDTAIKTGAARVFVFEERIAYCPSCKEILNVPVLRYTVDGKERTAVKKCPDCAVNLTLLDDPADSPKRGDQTLNNLGVTKENLTASESGIQDINTAKKMMILISNRIILQAEQAILAQTSQLPQAVLELLG